MTAPIEITQYDPIGAQSNPVRTLSGILDMQSITLDVDYSYARWLYVGVGGNINIKKPDGTMQLLLNLAGGVWHPIHSIGIATTTTTATNIVVGF